MLYLAGLTDPANSDNGFQPAAPITALATGQAALKLLKHNAISTRSEQLHGHARGVCRAVELDDARPRAGRHVERTRELHRFAGLGVAQGEPALADLLMQTGGVVRRGHTFGDRSRRRRDGDCASWREVGEVHAQVFADIRPAATMVEVARLIAPELLVEIEADAYLER